MKIRFIIFIFISATMILDNVWRIGGSAFLGLSLKNIVFYLSFFILIGLQLSQRESLIKKIPSLVPINIFFVFGAISLLYSDLFSEGITLNPIESLTEFKAKLLDPIFLYISGSILFKSEKDSSNAIQILISLYAILNILSLISFLTGINIIGKDVLSHSGQRFSSFGPIANQGAYALAFLVPLFFYFLQKTQSTVLKIFFLMMVFGCFGGIMLTGSRGAYLLVPLMIVGFSVLTKNIRLLSFSVIGGVLAFGLLSASNPDFLMNAFDRMLRLQSSDIDEVSSGRTKIWWGIFELIRRNPEAIVIGIGWGTLRAHTYSVLGWLNAAHNYYLKIFVELGLVGLGILITGISVYLYKFFRLTHKKSLFFLQCAVCAFFVLFWNTTLASLESFMLYYAWFIGLITNYAINLSATKSESVNTEMNTIDKFSRSSRDRKVSALRMCQ